MIQRPGGVGDIGYIPGDPLTLSFFFHALSGETPVDVSSSEFEIRCSTDKAAQVVVPELDVSAADAGFVRVYFSPLQTSTLPLYVKLAVFESYRWGRTILSGRLNRSSLIGGSFTVVPTIEDQIEVLIPVAVADTNIPDGTTWDTLGAIIWNDLGDITWENI